MEQMNTLSPAALFRCAFAAPEQDDATRFGENWDDIATKCIQGLKDGSIALFGCCKDDSLLDYDGPVMGDQPTGTLAALNRLAQMHPLFAQFCRECEEAAARLNAAPMRLGFYNCDIYSSSGWQANWINSNLLVYANLFVELDFLFLSPNAAYSVAFGSYCNHGCASRGGMKSDFYLEHSWLDIRTFAAANDTEANIQFQQKFVSRLFSGKSLFPCPFCGHRYVKSGLMGRKCPTCRRVLPKK